MRARGAAVQNWVGCRAGILNHLRGEGPPHASHAAAHAEFSRVHCPQTHKSDSSPLEAPAPGCAVGAPWFRCEGPPAMFGGVECRGHLHDRVQG